MWSDCACAYAGAAAALAGNSAGNAAGGSGAGNGSSTSTAAGGTVVSTPMGTQPQHRGAGGAAGGCVLQRLNLSSNGAGVGVVPAVCSMLRCCGSLQEVDLSCNQLGQRLSTDIISAAGASSMVLSALDVRGCGIGAEAEGVLQQLLLDRAAEREAAKLFAWAGSSGSSGPGAGGR